MAKFPPPWTYADYNNACFIVSDARGRHIAYVYYERDLQALPKALLRDEAEAMAKWIASTPERFASAKPAKPE